MMMVNPTSKVEVVRAFVVLCLRDVPFAFCSTLARLELVDGMGGGDCRDHPAPVPQIVRGSQAASVHSCSHEVDRSYPSSFHREDLAYLEASYEVVVVRYPSYGVVDRHHVDCSSSSFGVDGDRVSLEVVDIHSSMEACLHWQQQLQRRRLLPHSLWFFHLGLVRW